MVKYLTGGALPQLHKAHIPLAIQNDPYRSQILQGMANVNNNVINRRRRIEEQLREAEVEEENERRQRRRLESSGNGIRMRHKHIHRSLSKRSFH